MFDLGHYLPYLINRAGSRLAVEFGREAQAHGIGIQEWRVLAALAAQGGQRLSDLALLTSIELSTLSRLVARMVQAGLVARDRASGDKREILVTLTPGGRRTTRSLIPVARRHERIALRGLSEGEAQSLRHLLKRVYANLDGLRLDADTP